MRNWSKNKHLTNFERETSTLVRFLASVDRSGDCWAWTGRVDHDGYGVLGVTEKNGRTPDRRAHRIAYKLAFDRDPGKSCVCHRCDNRRCVNPDHLFLGTSEENTADRDAKSRQARGERQGLSKLTESTVRDIRAALRRCDRQVDVARRFGVSQSLISAVKLRQVWGHVE